MEKRIIAFLLLALCLVQIPMTAYADSGNRIVETYKDLVPDDAESEEFQHLIMFLLNDLSMTQLSSDYGVATALLLCTVCPRENTRENTSAFCMI